MFNEYELKMIAYGLQRVKKAPGGLHEAQKAILEKIYKELDAVPCGYCGSLEPLTTFGGHTWPTCPECGGC